MYLNINISGLVVGQALAVEMKKTFVGMLKGTLTDISQVTPSNLWLPDISSSSAGSFGACNWTTVYTSTYVDVLMNDSSIPNKKIYISFDVSAGDGTIKISSGTSFNSTSGLWANPIYEIISFNPDPTVHLPLNYRVFATNSSFTITAPRLTTGNSASHEIISVFDGFNNAFDTYSMEGRTKILRIGGTAKLSVSNRYKPADDVYTSGATVYTQTYYNVSPSIGIERILKADLLRKKDLKIPLYFRDLSIGWLGGNTSPSTNVYLSSDRAVEAYDEIIIDDVDDSVYHVVKITPTYLYTYIIKE